MYEDLSSAVDELMPAIQSELGDLVRIDSVSAAGFDPSRVRASAVASAAQLEAAGYGGVRLLELDDDNPEGAHPGVYAELPAPPGAPTVLLYAHHDVQPPGPAELWSTSPFEPTEANGRLYGRGATDDKSGIVIHTGALRALDGRPPVGVKVFLEGEEEIGSLHLDAFLARYEELLAADAIVIADAGNWQVGEPGFTTSLRGLVDCTIEVSTFENGVHSGVWGGAFPDALTALVRVLATLHDDGGDVAIDGLHRAGPSPVDLEEDEARSQSGVFDEVALLTDGSITQRLWFDPAVSILAIDAPPVSEAINQLLPTARAKISVRIAPGDDPDSAMRALVEHLEANVPWGARIKVTPGASAHPFALDTTGSGLRRVPRRLPGGVRKESGRHGDRWLDPVRESICRCLPGCKHPHDRRR